MEYSIESMRRVAVQQWYNSASSDELADVKNYFNSLDHTTDWASITDQAERESISKNNAIDGLSSGDFGNGYGDKIFGSQPFEKACNGIGLNEDLYNKFMTGDSIYDKSVAIDKYDYIVGGRSGDCSRREESISERASAYAYFLEQEMKCSSFPENQRESYQAEVEKIKSNPDFFKIVEAKQAIKTAVMNGDQKAFDEATARLQSFPDYDDEDGLYPMSDKELERRIDGYESNVSNQWVQSNSELKAQKEAEYKNYITEYYNRYPDNEKYASLYNEKVLGIKPESEPDSEPEDEDVAATETEDSVEDSIEFIEEVSLEYQSESSDDSVETELSEEEKKAEFDRMNEMYMKQYGPKTYTTSVSVDETVPSETELSEEDKKAEFDRMSEMYRKQYGPKTYTPSVSVDETKLPETEEIKTATFSVSANGTNSSTNASVSVEETKSETAGLSDEEKRAAVEAWENKTHRINSQYDYAEYEKNKAVIDGYKSDLGLDKKDPYAFTKPAREDGMSDDDYAKLCADAEQANRDKVHREYAQQISDGTLKAYDENNNEIPCCGSARIKALEEAGFDAEGISSIQGVLNEMYAPKEEVAEIKEIDEVKVDDVNVEEYRGFGSAEFPAYHEDVPSLDESSTKIKAYADYRGIVFDEDGRIVGSFSKDYYENEQGMLKFGDSRNEPESEKDRYTVYIGDEGNIFNEDGTYICGISGYGLTGIYRDENGYEITREEYEELHKNDEIELSGGGSFGGKLTSDKSKNQKTLKKPEKTEDSDKTDKSKKKEKRTLERPESDKNENNDKDKPPIYSNGTTINPKLDNQPAPNGYLKNQPTPNGYISKDTIDATADSLKTVTTDGTGKIPNNGSGSMDNKMKMLDGMQTVSDKQLQNNGLQAGG